MVVGRDKPDGSKLIFLGVRSAYAVKIPLPVIAFIVMDAPEWKRASKGDADLVAIMLT